MELLQSTAIDSQTYLIISKQNKTKQYWHAYNKKRQEYLLNKQQERRLQLKLSKPPKPRSLFLIQREKNFINCLDKHHITVPIPRSLKTKHPIIQGWNKPNWWWKEKIPQLLAKGHNYFTLLNKDGSYKGVRIGCLDIDEKGWTKIPTKYWCCYISANNGKIKLLFLYEDNCGLKTGKGYFQGKPILDFKISGGIMGIGSFHPNGKPYQVKGAGSFFLKNNHIFKNPYEIIELLKQDFGIEIKSMREHFLLIKIKQKYLEKSINKLKPFKSVREPPRQKLRIKQNNSSRIAHYR